MLDGMRIASLVLEGHVNAVYRSLIPMQALAHRGHTVHIEERDDVRDIEALLGFDVVHFWRGFQEPMRRAARRLREAGIAVVWDNDDDITTLPQHHPVYQRIGGMRGQAIVAQLTAMMRLADVVTSPTEILSERLRQASGADVRVLGNYLPPTFTRPDRVMPHNGVTIGWVAGLDRRHDFDQLGVRDALTRLLTRHHHLEVIGIGLDLGLKSHRYRHTPGAGYGELPQHLTHLDIALAPITDIPFNQVRSDVKLKEYAAVGVPWLASPIGPYAGLGEEQGGRLVPDGDWYAAIEQLITDADARRRLAHRGRQWAQGETIEHHIDRWEQTFADAIEHARTAHAVR